DIKVAVVGAMSGPVAQWGDMEFNGARQAIKDINASGGIKGDKPALLLNMAEDSDTGRLFVTDNSKAKTTLVLDIHSGKLLK
ncbi:ABC transporter substrate-binding protein, partial [Klebsiella pneumoniae]|uniref:ABC transporter substrate-binding protein n=1 Tax=Klebsiella pneumoniae TaxID=573 RepID=UPI001D0DD1F9